MKLYTEEKKQTICIGGVAVAACRLLYPRIEGKEKINEFYKQITENLVLFFCEKAEAHRKSFARLERRERKSFPQLRMNTFFALTHADEKIISLTREYVLCEGKTLLAYRKSGEIWGAESELLLPAQMFFPRKLRKKAEANEFYFDGGAVLVENLFPESRGDGRRIRLADYIIETRVECK